MLLKRTISSVNLNAARRPPRPGACWEEDMMPGLGLLLSQDVGVQRLRGEE